MTRDNTPSRLAAFLAALLVLGACGGGGSDGAEVFDSPATDAAARPSDEPGSVDVDRTTGISADSADLTDDQLVDLLVTYDDYVSTQDFVKLGDTQSATDLAELAAPSVVAQSEAWYEQNVRSATGDSAIVDVTSWANVEEITGSADGAILHDCLEEEITDDLLGLTRSNFVDQLVMFRLVDDRWFIDEVQVRHDGETDRGRIGCVPAAHADRVEATVEEFLGLVDATWQHPDQEVPELASLTDPSLRAEIVDAQQGFADEGVYFDAPQQHTITVEGSDALVGNRAFVVGVCTLLPEGLTPRSADTGEAVDDGAALPPGLRLNREFSVGSARDDGGEYRDTVLSVLKQEPDSSCEIEGA